MDLTEKKTPVPFTPSILVAEDDAETRRMICRTLEEVGFRVVEAATGKEAWEHVVERHFDLIILDVSLPERDGLELIQSVRAEAGNVKVLAVSGFMGGSFLRTIEKLGADATLKKPITEDDLLMEVCCVLATHLL